MSDRVSFQCGSCRARLKAAANLAGQAGQCPACGETLVVPKQVPDEAGPILVLDDGTRRDRQVPRSWY